MTTPRDQGYKMPPEWTPHAATWVSWPRRAGISFRYNLEEALAGYARMVNEIARFEPVHINVVDAAMESEARAQLTATTNIHFHPHPTNEPWCRDHGPTFVTGHGRAGLVDWIYNAYGGKFAPCDADDAVPRRVADFLGLPRFTPGMVLEGGSIDVNGAGAVLVTEACLLHPNRNPKLSRSEIAGRLREYLGVEQVLWLGQGLAGDDTDGHVDDLTRFVGPSTVVTAIEADPADVNYAALQDNRRRLESMAAIETIIELPMPGPIEFRGNRLPASYANFYIANGLVLVPQFDDPNDAVALEILSALFPGRQVIGLDSRALICGGGSFHCLTQQQPAA